MGYDNMDHAGWVEENIRAAKNIRKGAIDKRRAKEGRGWLAAPDKLNDFERRAFTLLGIVGGGIYNAPIAWESLRWGRHWMALRWELGHGFATWDGSQLTNLVFLAHDAAIRLHISPAMRGLELVLHQRKHHADTNGPVSEGHPTLEQAWARYRARIPLTHPVHFKEPAKAKEEE